MSLSSIRSTWRTMSFGLMSAGRDSCRRLKASSCFVSAAARFVVSLISSAASRRAPMSPSSLRTNSAFAPMTISRLLKSCAIPPASRPTTSSFCVCCSCSSSAARCVMSRELSTMPRTAGSSSRLLASVSMIRAVPSACIMRQRSDSVLNGLAATRRNTSRASSRSSAATRSTKGRSRPFSGTNPRTPSMAGLTYVARSS